MSAVRLLGVDGGGTSTDAWLADGDGTVLGRGHAGPSNSKAVGLAPALEALETAIASAFHSAGEAPRAVDAACLGLAGFGRPDDQSLLHDWCERRHVARTLLPVTDGDLVIAAGTPEGYGIGVISGTGSIAVGRARDGATARAGGWGPLIGDEGSAYAVVLAALRKVARRADGRDAPRDPDPLTRAMLRALETTDLNELIPALHSPGMVRTKIAALVPAVLAAAADDPSVDAELLAPAGRELAEMVLAVTRALPWKERALPLAFAGGFLLAADAVRESLLAHLAEAGYAPEALPVADPVRGALVLASKAL